MGAAPVDRLAASGRVGVLLDLIKADKTQFISSSNES